MYLTPFGSPAFLPPDEAEPEEVCPQKNNSNCRLLQRNSNEYQNIFFPSAAT
jgi:hypothetical protein